MWNSIMSAISDSIALRPEVFMVLVKSFLFSLVSGFLSAYLGQKKGYPYIIWFLIGFFTRIYGLITIAGLPIKKGTHES
jgi:small basic protein